MPKNNMPTHFTVIFILVVLLASVFVAGSYGAPSQSVPLEVKEPLEVTDYNSTLSLYPGETVNFTVGVENHASVNYKASLILSLNDGEYQKEYVTFSSDIYSIEPGANSIDAWLFVDSVAPAADLTLTVGITRNVDGSPTIDSKDILCYCPITIFNDQDTATPAPFQQMLTIDSSSFEQYEASNLQNIEFLDASGKVLLSWLESGNSNTATSTVYWLLLPDGIPANSNVTVYMAFASPTVNLFNNRTTGEAPQLSPIYGEYDNGAKFFSFYDNFAGTNLNPQWRVFSSAGSMTINDGITLIGSAYEWQDIGSVAFFNPQTQVFDANIFFSALLGSVVSHHPGPTCTTGWDVPWGLPQDVSPEYCLGDLAGSYALYNCAEGEATGVPIEGGSTSDYNVWSVWEGTDGQSYLTLSYGESTTTNDQNFKSSTSSQVGIASLHTSPVNARWVRLRSLPPDAVMPTFSVGEVVSSCTQSISVPTSTDFESFPIQTNSSLSDFSFNSTDQQFNFTVTGPDDSTGYVNVYLPDSVDNASDVEVSLDGQPLNFTTQTVGDACLVSFNYHHSTHVVSIRLNFSNQNPAFIPSWVSILITISLPVALIIAITKAFLSINRKKYRSEIDSARRLHCSLS